MKPYILIIEDELHIAQLLELNLTLDGYETQILNGGMMAMSTISNKRPNLILLDVMLPDINGVELCATIKKRYPSIPILILSALGQSSDRIKGLKSGADDYIPKPFNLEELLLKIDKILTLYRNDYGQKTDIKVYKIGDVKYHPDRYCLESGDRILNLNSKEAKLLSYLLQHRGMAIERTELIHKIWGKAHEGNPRTIDNYISNIRKFIERDPQKPVYLKTIRGVGYMISPTKLK